ncbi:ABC transporter substrate-binding protein [Thermodesulfobacteriota bacterium]
MRRKILYLTLIMVSCIAATLFCSPSEAFIKTKILVISSYHREYIWSQETNEGFCAAMTKYGYFDEKSDISDKNDQVAEYTKNDYIENSKVIVKRLWMNTKKKKSAEEIANTVSTITRQTKEFKPDLIFLGDDNAAKYIGAQFLDTKIPIVFWGMNNTPVKYGLVDSIESPGHNVTGVYQSGYYQESLELLKKIVPSIKNFAVISDDTASGRSHVKKIERLAHKGDLRIKLVAVVVESDFERWKRKVLKLQDRVDAFFIAQYSGLTSADGSYVPTDKIVEWYMKKVKIPEVAVQGQFVKQGMLCSADDSGYNQGYTAVEIAHDILSKGNNPATYSPISPKRGAFMANKKRGKMLGISFTEDMGIEQYIK